MRDRALDNRLAIELPAYAPDSATHFVQYSYVLNRNAPNKEAAAYFLECLISRSALLLTYPDVSMGYLADVTPADVEQQHSSLRNNPRWIGISEQNHQIWLDAMANGMPENYAIADASRAQWKELFPAYLNDEITLDQYIAALQQNMDAVLGQ